MLYLCLGQMVRDFRYLSAFFSEQVFSFVTIACDSGLRGDTKLIYWFAFFFLRSSLVIAPDAQGQEDLGLLCQIVRWRLQCGFTVSPHLIGMVLDKYGLE